MKKYKLINSKAAREKAKRLGLVPLSANLNTGDVFLFVDEIDYFTREHKSLFLTGSDDYEEVTQKDFLALPEPIKVGDWVKFVYLDEGKEIIFIGEVDLIAEDEVKIYGATGLKPILTREHLTKLTPEQIKILELE